MRRRRIRTRHPRSGLALAVVVAALVGCGGDGGPRVERSDAAPLLALTHRIPHEAACAQARDIAALRTRVTGLVNAQRVPAELQEPLSSGVNALVAAAPPCLPEVEAAAPARSSAGDEDERKGKGRGHEKHKHGRGD